VLGEREPAPATRDRLLSAMKGTVQIGRVVGIFGSNRRKVHTEFSKADFLPVVEWFGGGRGGPGKAR